jgi:hypothetical protein
MTREEFERDAARDLLESMGYLVLPPEGADIDPGDAAEAIKRLRADGHLREHGACPYGRANCRPGRYCSACTDS